MNDANKLNTAVEEAEEAFWQTIVEHYPEITTGDFDFGLTQKRDILNAESVKMWLEWNTPKQSHTNPIKSFIDASSNLWQYYDGSFWAVITYQGKPALICCPANANGTPDMDNAKPNACDVEECEQHHLDFVNENFKTKFRLHPDSISDNGIGCPTAD